MNSLFSGLTPVGFVVQSVIILALIILLGAIWMRPEGRSEQWRKNRQVSWGQRLVDNERATAKWAGFTFSRWIALRVVLLVVLIGFGIWSEIPILMALSVLAGIGGLKWLMAPRAEKRKLNIERSFLHQMRITRDRMFKQGLSLDVSILEMVNHSPRELKEILAPLLEEGSISDRLAKVSQKSGIPLISQMCSALIIARGYDRSALLGVLNDNLLPLGEHQVEMETGNLEVLSQQRGYVYAMIMVIVVALLSVLRVPSFQTTYASFGGQLVLMGDATLFAGIAWGLGRLLRARPLGNVDSEVVKQRIGGGGG